MSIGVLDCPCEAVVRSQLPSLSTDWVCGIALNAPSLHDLPHNPALDSDFRTIQNVGAQKKTVTLKLALPQSESIRFNLQPVSEPRTKT